MSGYAGLREKHFGGFAHRYLRRRIEQESKSDDQIDIQVYTKLVQLDSKLGTTATEQLLGGVFALLRLDLLKVKSLNFIEFW